MNKLVAFLTLWAGFTVALVAYLKAQVPIAPEDVLSYRVGAAVVTMPFASVIAAKVK